MAKPNEPDLDPNVTARQRKPNRGRWQLVLVIVLAVVVSFLWYIGVIGGNVRTIVPGEAYRSAQLTGDTLGNVLAADHIGTVINLRGGTMAKAFYRSEMFQCARHGTAHIDVSLSSSKLPTPNELDRLVAALDTARRPILVHCQAGADRTGLVSTLFMSLEEGVPVRQAESEELNWRYGHFSFGASHAMNDFFNLYYRTSGGMSLRQWIMVKYPALYLQQPRQLRNLNAELQESASQTAPASAGG